MGYGDYIREHRRALGLTQKELGERSGIHKNVISAWEHESSSPVDYRTISALEDALEVPPGELYLLMKNPGCAQVRHRPARVVTVAESPAASTASA